LKHWSQFIWIHNIILNSTNNQFNSTNSSLLLWNSKLNVWKWYEMSLSKYVIIMTMSYDQTSSTVDFKRSNSLNGISALLQILLSLRIAIRLFFFWGKTGFLIDFDRAESHARYAQIYEIDNIREKFRFISLPFFERAWICNIRCNRL